MADEQGQSGTVFLIALLITTLVVGVFVLIVNPDYRIEQNLISNEDYYPHVEVKVEID